VGWSMLTSGIAILLGVLAVCCCWGTAPAESAAQSLCMHLVSCIVACRLFSRGPCCLSMPADSFVLVDGLQGHLDHKALRVHREQMGAVEMMGLLATRVTLALKVSCSCWCQRQVGSLMRHNRVVACTCACSCNTRLSCARGGCSHIMRSHAPPAGAARSECACVCVHAVQVPRALLAIHPCASMAGRWL
jgi:hypothetical protein